VEPLEFAEGGNDGGSRRALLGFGTFLGEDQTVEQD
jgi:hypothetical protein